MDTAVKLIIVGSVVAAVAALWYAIRKYSRKIGDHQRDNLVTLGARSAESSFKATGATDAVLRVPTHAPIETGASTQTNLGEKTVTASAHHLPAPVSEELESSTKIASSCENGDHAVSEVDIHQKADAPSPTHSEGAPAMPSPYTHEQLTGAPERAADTESLAALNDSGAGIVGLQGVAAREATPQLVSLTVPNQQISDGPHKVGEQVGMVANLPGPELNVVREHLDSEETILPNSPVQVAMREAHTEVKTDSLSTDYPTRSEEKNRVQELTQVKAIEIESTDRSTHATANNKTRRPPKYQPSIRVAEVSSRAASVRETNESISEKTRSLSVLLHIAFDRRNRYRTSLLPARNEDLDQIERVDGPNGEESWTSQDEWFGDITPANIETLLEQGAVWHSLKDPALQWVLSGREVYVLAQDPTISAFVSTSRLSLHEDQLVLVKKGLEGAARNALLAAGCSNLTVIDGERGVPFGWVLFRNVRPTIAVLHDSEAGILNVLRPIHEVEIVLRGGIRLSYSSWLQGHPPQIRLKGAREGLEVMIDGHQASVDGAGGYQAAGSNEPGKHTVFCGGVLQSYNLVSGVEDWEPFEAFAYQPTWGRGGPLVTICGPSVASRNPNETLLISTLGNTCLLGSVPGQIVVSSRRYNVSSKEFLAVVGFPVVWALPAAPLQCDRTAVKITLVSPNSPSPAPRSLTRVARIASLRWCYAILESCYKRLDIEPGTADAKTLWQEYKNEAYRLKKLLR